MSAGAQISWDAQPQGGTQVQWDAPQQEQRPKAPTGKDWLKSATWLPKLSRTLGQTADWAQGKRDDAEQANLHEVATTGKSSQPVAAFTKGAGYDLLMRAARKASGLTSPAGVATTIAGLAAPEIVGPAMIAHGLGTAAGNAKEAIGGNPEAVDATLTGLAEGAAGGATAGEGFSAGQGVKGTLQQTNTGRLLRAGQNKITTMQLGDAPKTLTQAIQPGVNIPRAPESIPIAGRRMQQVMRDRGMNMRQESGEGATPVTEKALDVIRESKKTVLSAIEDRLGPVADLQPDVSAVAKAMRGTVDKISGKQFKGAKDGIEQRAGVYDEGGFTLRDIENRIIAANKSLRGFYKQPTAGENPTSMDMDATLAEVKTLRDLLDEKVDTLSGDGVKDLKREYGALRDVERATARQHAIGTRAKEGKLWEGLAYLHAAGDLMSGNVLGAAKAGAALSVGNMLTRLRDPNFLLEQSFHGPKAFEAADAIPAHAGPPAPKALLRDTNEHGLPEISSNPVPDTSGPARGGRWTTPKAALTDEKPQVAKFLRVINKNPPRSPLGLLRESNTPSSNIPPMVDEKFATEATGTVSDPNRLGARGQGGIRTTPKGELPAVTGMYERARLLVQQTLDVMRSGDRPGRYYDENEMGEYNSQKEQSASRGVTSGGRWRGVKSSRTMLPWINETEFTPAELEGALRLAEKGKANRVLNSALEFIKREAKKNGATEREPGEEEAPF